MPKSVASTRQTENVSERANLSKCTKLTNFHSIYPYLTSKVYQIQEDTIFFYHQCRANNPMGELYTRCFSAYYTW